MYLCKQTIKDCSENEDISRLQPYHGQLEASEGTQRAACSVQLANRQSKAARNVSLIEASGANHSRLATQLERSSGSNDHNKSTSKQRAASEANVPLECTLPQMKRLCDLRIEEYNYCVYKE